MRPEKPTLILIFMCMAFLLQIAPGFASDEGNTYLVQLNNGAEIICDKMSVDGDTLFYRFYSYGRKKVGINKKAIKAIFVREEGQGDEPSDWGENILPQVMNPSQRPRQ